MGYSDGSFRKTLYDMSSIMCDAQIKAINMAKEEIKNLAALLVVEDVSYTDFFKIVDDIVALSNETERIGR